jgi:hypothetical protein
MKVCWRDGGHNVFGDTIQENLRIMETDGYICTLITCDWKCATLADTAESLLHSITKGNSPLLSGHFLQRCLTYGNPLEQEHLCLPIYPVSRLDVKVDNRKPIGILAAKGNKHPTRNRKMYFKKDIVRRRKIFMFSLWRFCTS